MYVDIIYQNLYIYIQQYSICLYFFWNYTFLKNNMDIFQALGMAGDLTINGKRDDIKIISKNDDTLNVKSVDLTSSDVLLSKNFQIFPGDIIIINANNARIKNAGVIGNFGNLLSVLSFVLSSLILISNN